MSLVRYSDAYLSELVENARASDPRALADVYALIKRTCKPLLLRALGPQHYEDVLQTVGVVIFDALNRGLLRESVRFIRYIQQVRDWQLIAFLRVSIPERRMLSSFADLPTYITETTCFAERRSDHNPDLALARKEKADILDKALRFLNVRDQEILIRFYLLEQSKEQVQERMSISERQFALLKSRALGKLRLRVERELTGSREMLGRLALAI